MRETISNKVLFRWTRSKWEEVLYERNSSQKTVQECYGSCRILWLAQGSTHAHLLKKV